MIKNVILVHNYNVLVYILVNFFLIYNNLCLVDDLCLDDDLLFFLNLWKDQNLLLLVISYLNHIKYFRHVNRNELYHFYLKLVTQKSSNHFKKNWFFLTERFPIHIQFCVTQTLHR